MAKKININTLINMKNKEEKVAWLTAYDLSFARAVEQAGIDMILVGDSGAMTMLGYSTTNPVTMDEMVMMASAVRRGAPDTFVIGDMPQGSYEISKSLAIKNALRFIKECGCDAIKLEGGQRVSDKVKAIVDGGILVFGHLGLTPQSAASFGGYRVQCKDLISFETTLKDAIGLQNAGICALLLEAMPTEPARQITKSLKIPVYGIGAGSGVDGQLLILHDMVGQYHAFRPWFAKGYIPDVIDDFVAHLKNLPDIRMAGREMRSDGTAKLIELAVALYIKEVKSGQFPEEEFCYPITEKELNELKKSPLWKE